MQENVNMSINKVKVEQEAVSMLKKIGPKSPFTNENCMSATKISLSFNLKDKNFEMINGIFSFNGGGPTKKNSHLRRYFFFGCEKLKVNNS